MVKYSALAAALIVSGAGFAAPAGAQPTLKPPPVRPNPATAEAIAAGHKGGAFPTFASIPPLPKDVRTNAAWKASVTGLKAKGAQLTEMAAAEPWSQADTEAFAAAMRARAMPPPRKR